MFNLYNTIGGYYNNYIDSQFQVKNLLPKAADLKSDSKKNIVSIAMLLFHL